MPFATSDLFNLFFVSKFGQEPPLQKLLHQDGRDAQQDMRPEAFSILFMVVRLFRISCSAHHFGAHPWWTHHKYFCSLQVYPL